MKGVLLGESFMPNRQPHRKRIKHYDELGDFHELTFSCYRRWKLLANDTWRGFLARTIDDAVVAEKCRLAAFVFMPEHVHVLIYPANYIHMNPVCRKLCRTAADWRWSSARWYLSGGRAVDPLLPTVHGVPSGLFAT